MNSINQNQPESNHHNLHGAAAIAKIKELAGKTNTCFFCTAMAIGESNGARPMTVQQIDGEGVLWFLSAADSHTVKEIGADPHVKLYFQGSAHSDFMELYGKAALWADKEKIKELWEPLLKTWFTEGESDPRIAVIRFAPLSGYYWDNKHGNAIAGIKMLVGAALGKTLDDSVEGMLKV